MINVCKISIYLAYLSCAYIMSSCMYLTCTKFIGTPFKDAIKEYPELLEIREKSSDTRRKIFIVSLVMSIIILYLWKPFSRCS